MKKPFSLATLSRQWQRLVSIARIPHAANASPGNKQPSTGFHKNYHPRILWCAALVLVAALVLLGPVSAFDGAVEKRVFEMPAYTTVGGQVIRKVRVGWESYGTLNESGDNAILITHHYTGTSHAAGRYSMDDERPGYWDAIIGSGKLIDTDKYFVISSDTLVNLNAYDPNVITTGPASLNPATGGPYGMGFPLVTIRDFVNVQRALVESLGITSLQAVMGASMGALQAIEWANAYPELVRRIIPVIGAGEVNAFLIAHVDIWASPIRLDPKWNGGDYYGAEPPMDGLRETMKMVTLFARHWEWTDKTFGRAWAEAGKDPAAAFENKYEIEAVLDAIARKRAANADANHFLYLGKACQNFIAGHGDSLAEGLAAIESPVLLIHAADDLLFFPEQIRQTQRLIQADGTPAEHVVLTGNMGHADGIVSIQQAADAITRFLAK
uniref:Probable acyltransferase n=1 Tax=Candidatus Kentrum eta TaxID=2126337 RepID=A0A450ULR8_9GAMM|nr:MAG: homoserine O-acetyltransferase [Candidatus Kentron sp. H]VFJ93479.1 MAG: homoserine O-acetyltransferase [Candidatus Kentron sp. H]VFK00263.1 MAG: homoserine O-acetyltransferase [Candidatus Kentron sp. H]